MATELLRSSSWQSGRRREPGRRTATGTTPVRFSTARWPRASSRWRSTGSGWQPPPPPPRSANSRTSSPICRTRTHPSRCPTSRSRRGIGAGGGWGMRAAVAGVLVVLGIAIGWGLYGNTTSPLSFTSDPGAKSDGITREGADAADAAAVAGWADRTVRADAADASATPGLRARRSTPSTPSLARPDPTDDRREAELHLPRRLGRSVDVGSKERATTSLVDLAKFDVKAIVGVLRGAPETLGHQADRRQETHYLSIDPSRDPPTPAR